MPWGKPGIHPFWEEGVFPPHGSVGVGQNEYFKDREALQQYRGEHGVGTMEQRLSFWRNCEQQGLGQGQRVSIRYGHHYPQKGTLPLCSRVMTLGNCHRLPCFVSWRIVKMSSPNLNIVTLLGSGLAYTSAYLFGIQEQSLPSGDSVEKLIQVSGGFAGSGAFTHANVCVYMHVCTCTFVHAFS